MGGVGKFGKKLKQSWEVCQWQDLDVLSHLAPAFVVAYIPDEHRYLYGVEVGLGQQISSNESIALQKWTD